MALLENGKNWTKKNACKMITDVTFHLCGVFINPSLGPSEKTWNNKKIEKILRIP